MSAHDTQREQEHDRFAELAVGHALNALEPAEEQQFLRHLRGCATCERDLLEHRETLGQLAYDALDEAPPASVLEGIRAGVAASGRGTGGAGLTGEGLAVNSAPTSIMSAPSRRKHTVPRSTALVGLAASAVLVLALTFLNVGLSTSRDETNQDNRRLTQAVAQLLVSGARTIDLTGGEGTRAVAVLNGSDLSLVVSGVPVNDQASSVYVLWEQSKFGDVRAVGAFDVGDSSLVVINGLRLKGASSLKALMVTREKGRKAPALTTQQPILVGTTA